MKTTQNIMQLLGMNYQHYDDIRHHYFLGWCYNLSQKHCLPLATLTKNDSLLNYYQGEWLAMIKQRILIDLKGYIDAGVMTKNILLDWIDFEAKELEAIEPIPLLKLIKKEYRNENSKQRLVGKQSRRN